MMSNLKRSTINGVPCVEERLILNILRKLNPERELKRQLDWQYLFEISEFHKITLFVVFALKQKISCDMSKVMSDLLVQKFDIKLQSARSQNQKVDELKNVLLEWQNLTKTKIVFMEEFVLKNCVYPLPDIREINCVDIWLQNQDIDKAFTFLEEQGFSISTNHKNKSDNYYKISLIPEKDNKITVNFHYNLPFLSFSSFYKLTKPHINFTIDVKINDSVISTVQSEYLLLYLILKMYVYNKLEFTLRDLLDIKYLTEQGVNSNIDLFHFTHLVKQLDLQDPTYFWFKLISYIFQTHHLDYVLSEILNDVRDSVKQDARHIGDNIDIFMKPGQRYVSKLRATFSNIHIGCSNIAISKFLKFMKLIVFISKDDFEKLYLERVNDPIDSKIRYFSHTLRFLPYYYVLLIQDT
jgi:hypothetical protein